MVRITIFGFLSLVLNNNFLYSNELIVSSENQPFISEQIRSEYILDTGDVIDIEFIDLEMFSNSFVINLEGFITNLPEIESFYARGKTLKEIKKDLLRLYSEYIYDPDINLSIKRYREIKVYISGEVNSPGFYKFDNQNNNNEKSKSTEFPTLFGVIKKANGVTNYANLSDIKLIRENSISQGGGKILTKLNLLNMIETGDQSNNILINDGDSIFISKSKDIILDQVLAINKTNLNPEKIIVYVTGNVVYPGPAKIKKGSSLVQAVASTGGKKLLTGNIEFLRFQKNGNTIKRSFRYNSNATINTHQNPILMNGDVINVKRTVFGNAAQVINEFRSPILSGYGLYKLFD